MRIKMAISSTAQDSDLVAGLVDRNKLILGEDGKVAGLEEQVKALKESKPFLFKQEQQTGKGKKGFFPLGAPKTRAGRRRRPYVNEGSDCGKIRTWVQKGKVNNYGNYIRRS